MKYALIRLGVSKRWHVARTDKHTVCGKRIYTMDWYAVDQSSEDGEKLCDKCDAKKDEEPAMLAGAEYSL